MLKAAAPVPKICMPRTERRWSWGCELRKFCQEPGTGAAPGLKLAMLKGAMREDCPGKSTPTSNRRVPEDSTMELSKPSSGPTNFPYTLQKMSRPESSYSGFRMTCATSEVEFSDQP